MSVTLHVTVSARPGEAPDRVSRDTGAGHWAGGAEVEVRGVCPCGVGGGLILGGAGCRHLQGVTFRRRQFRL